MDTSNADKTLAELGAKPSPSEESGLSLVRDEDKTIFSPGISTGGFAEIRMVREHPARKVIATTIDKEGLAFAEDIIKSLGFQNQVETRLEDLTGEWKYPANYFDFIYARLVLHYLPVRDLEVVLENFAKSLKPEGRIFVVVRSVKNINANDPYVRFDPDTKMTTYPHYDSSGALLSTNVRYFHTPESIQTHLEKAGLKVGAIKEYQEQLYRDFMRRDMSPHKDHVIELVATKSS